MQPNTKRGLILLITIISALLIWNQHHQINSTQAKVSTQPTQEITQTEAADQDKQVQALRLAAQSGQILDETYEGLVRSVLLATESLHRWPTVEGHIALRRGMSLLLRPVIQFNPGANISIGAFTPDLSRLATGREGGIVQIWDMATGQPTNEMHHDSRWVWSITFSSDGRWLATGSDDKTARVWDTATGQEIVRLNLDSNVNAVAFSADGQWLATGSGDNTARIWEIKTGREVASFLHEQYVEAVALSPDGKWLATGSGDGTARIWDLAAKNELKRFTHYTQVEFVGFTADGKLLVTSNAGKVKVWDVMSNEVMKVIEEDVVKIVALSSDGRWLATGSNDGLFRVWDINTGKEVGRTIHPNPLSSIAIGFSADSHQLATGNFYGPIGVWQIEPLPEMVLKGEGEVAINEVIFSPNSHWLAAKREDNMVQLWAISSTQEIAHIQHQNQIHDFTFSPDSRWLATASADNTAQILNIAHPNEVVLLKHDGPVNQVAFSPDDRQAATASNDGTARIWEVKTGKEMIRLEHGTSADTPSAETAGPNVKALDFNPDNRHLVTGSTDGTARIWDVTTGKELARFYHKPFIESHDIMSQTFTTTYTWSVDDVVFSQNGRWLQANSSSRYATGSFERARIWEVTTQQEISASSIAAFSPDSTKVALYSYSDIRVSELSVEPKVLWSQSLNGRQILNFSPDGKLLATGRWNPRYNDGDAHIWDVLTGQEVAFLPHPGQVLKVAFTPDSQWVATVSTGSIGPNYEGGGTRLWHAVTSREVIYFADSKNMAFSPDGRWLAVGSSNGSIHLLYLQSEDLIVEACSRLPRNLTKQEWRQYLGDAPYQATCPTLPIPKN